MGRGPTLAGMSGRVSCATFALLDLAFGVVADASAADKALWWCVVWPRVQQVERALRTGLRPAPRDELELLRALTTYGTRRNGSR